MDEYWGFQMDNITADSTQISLRPYAYVDTGTFLIVGPVQDIQTLTQALDAIYDASTGLYTVNCLNRSLSSFPDIIFNINGTPFPLKSLQYIQISGNDSGSFTCYLIFQGKDIQDSNDNPCWVLGNSFLMRYYSAFDLISNTVGFATSVSYNWTQYIDPSLFPASAASSTATGATEIATSAATGATSMETSIATGATSMDTSTAAATNATLAITTSIPTTTYTTNQTAAISVQTTTMPAATVTVTTVPPTTSRFNAASTSIYKLSSYFYFFFALVVIIFLHT